MTCENLEEQFSGLARPWLAVELDFQSRRSSLWMIPRSALFEAFAPWAGCRPNRGSSPAPGILGGTYEETLLEILFAGVTRLSDDTKFNNHRHFWPAPRESERFVGTEFFGAKIEVGRNAESGMGPARSRDWIDKRLRESFSVVLGPFEGPSHRRLEDLSAAAQTRAVLCSAELEAQAISDACASPTARRNSMEPTL